MVHADIADKFSQLYVVNFCGFPSWLISSPDSSTRQSSVRKLPPTPAVSSTTTTASTATFTMPEPEPYFDPLTRASQYSAESYHSAQSSSSSSLRKQLTSSASIGGRRLPITPGQTHGIAYTRSPLPSDISGLHRIPSSASHANPPEKTAYREDGSRSSGHSPSTSRTSYDLESEPISPRASVYDINEKRAVDNGYHHKQSQPPVLQEYSPYDRDSSRSLGISQPLCRTQIPEYIMPQAVLSPTQIDSLNPCEYLSNSGLLMVE